MGYDLLSSMLAPDHLLDSKVAKVLSSLRSAAQFGMSSGVVAPSSTVFDP
jgi:hypothetical protein